MFITVPANGPYISTTAASIYLWCKDYCTSTLDVTYSVRQSVRTYICINLYWPVCSLITNYKARPNTLKAQRANPLCLQLSRQLFFCANGEKLLCPNSDTIISRAPVGKFKVGQFFISRIFSVCPGQLGSSFGGSAIKK